MNNKYTSENNTFQQLENKITLPSFQRSLVWSKNDKKQFIDTLHEGFPFGSILIYKYENDKKYSLIDGLQRYSTILDFKKNPQNYIPFDPYKEKLFNLLFPLETSKSAKDKLQKKINEAILGYISYLQSNDEDLNAFASILAEMVQKDKSDIDKIYRDLYTVHKDLLKYIEDYIDVERILIPTIVFTGDTSELPIVFQNLNRTGRKLSKYQVFAASWSNLVIKLSEDSLNSSLLDETINRYNRLIEERELEIENYSETEMLENREINLSELCYALGKLILRKMNVFWSYDNDDLANQIGHSTLAIVLNISNKKIADLAKHFETINDNALLENMMDKILEIFIEINSYFERYFRMPGTKKVEYYGSAAASDLQMLSIFGSLWNTRFGNILENQQLHSQPHYKINYKKIKTNLIKHFIVDSVQSKWVGTGDTKLDDIVIEGNIPYLYEVPKETMNNLLFHWHDEIMKKRSVIFEKTSRMLYTVLMTFYSNELKADSYDKEHVISKKILSNKNHSIPGGSLGNLMYLDVTNNRAKGEFSLYEVLKEGHCLGKVYTNTQSYPSQTEFDKIHESVYQQNPDYEVVIATIKNRGQNLLNDLMNKLYP